MNQDNQDNRNKPLKNNMKLTEAEIKRLNDIQDERINKQRKAMDDITRKFRIEDNEVIITKSGLEYHIPASVRQSFGYINSREDCSSGDIQMVFDYVYHNDGDVWDARESLNRIYDCLSTTGSTGRISELYDLVFEWYEK